MSDFLTGAPEVLRDVTGVTRWKGQSGGLWLNLFVDFFVQSIAYTLRTKPRTMFLVL